MLSSVTINNNVTTYHTADIHTNIRQNAHIDGRGGGIGGGVLCAISHLQNFPQKLPAINLLLRTLKKTRRPSAHESVYNSRLPRAERVQAEVNNCSPGLPLVAHPLLLAVAI